MWGESGAWAGGWGQVGVSMAESLGDPRRMLNTREVPVQDILEIQCLGVVGMGVGGWGWEFLG